MKKITLILFGFLFILPISVDALPNPDAIVGLVNQERTKIGLNPLKVNYKLVEAAKTKAVSLAKIEDLKHTKSINGGLWWPLIDAGYVYRLVGENLALNIEIPEEVVSSWMGSPSHRENILERSFEDIGVAVASGYFEGLPASYLVMYTATPKSDRVLGAFSENKKSEEEIVKELMDTIIALLKEILLIQKNLYVS